MEVPIELCVSAKVYKQSSFRKGLITAIFVALYSAAIPYCYYTSGSPRKAAMINAQKIADEKWASLGNSTSLIDVNDTSSASTSSQYLEEREILPDSSLSRLLSSSSAALKSGDASKQDDFHQDESVNDAQSSQISPKDLSTTADNDAVMDYSKTGQQSSSGSWFGNMFGPSKEQKRAKKEFDAWQKSFNERSPDGPVSLPPSYLPSAWACLALFATLTLHALFHLMGHWVVQFRATSQYSPSKVVDENSVVLVVPPANRGKAAIVNVRKIAATNSLQIEFQRQTYIYTPSKLLGAASKEYINGVFTLLSCPVNLALTHYTGSRGLISDAEIERITLQWGKNHLAVPVPSFLELLQIQLLSPLAIFQVFCALLWLLDEYWTFTLWSLVSVVIFEATTVFQRTRTQKMLGGMSPIPSPIYAYRGNKWIVVTTKDLLPGDLVSLAFRKRSGASKASAEIAVATTGTDGSNEVVKTTNEIPPTCRDELVPVDCVLISGSAVVNESSLTGESIPQMKEALAPGAETASTLDINNLHRVSTLFSGTSIVTVDGASGVGGRSIQRPPDNGAIAYVLRTGFSSSQGTLMQMIEFSQQSVSGDNHEVGLALLMLFVFALVAAGYVLKEGLRKKEKTTHELLLKCVIIITSVVPRQFPMQMAMAVNMALMALFKTGVFCTEPFRVPLAGKVTHCLFDKTGTLTTDQLVPVGVINAASPVFRDRSASSEQATISESNAIQIPMLSPVSDAAGVTAIILAACHSLVVVEDDSAASGSAQNSNLVGDPIEVAAIKGVEWSWDAKSSTATPGGSISTQTSALNLLKNKLKEVNEVPTPQHSQHQQQHKAVVDSITSQIVECEKRISESKIKMSKAFCSSVRVLQRHHFSSSLQRMSVVCKCITTSTSSSGSKSSTTENYCLVKGSPEAIYGLLENDGDMCPTWYKATYETMARKGLRVLALAYKQTKESDNAADRPRPWVESNLVFAGFIAFECKIRGDSSIVIRSLIESDHRVSMLTGDALLTSLHVAKSVGICKKHKQSVTLNTAVDITESQYANGKPSTDYVFWSLYDDSKGTETKLPFNVYDIDNVADQYDLLTTEKDFLNLIEVSGGKDSKMWKSVPLIQVFARMSPQGKASIIQAIQKTSKDNFVLMCGDGGNDVGALKQADVGIALLAGHENANTTEVVENALAKSSDSTAVAAASTSAVSAEDALNLHSQALSKRSEAFNVARNAHMKAFQAKFQKQQADILQEEMKKRIEKGEYMALFGVMKDQAVNMRSAMEAENRRYMAISGQVWDPKKDGLGVEDKAATGLDSLMTQLESGDGASAGAGVPMVRPGDASVAAPFTSRVPSIRAVVDLIRQGRCTLLSALMQQQIMMLESIIAAYTLSALSLHNARSSERQMMASSWLIMTAAVSFSYASPLDHMHPLRPLRSLFHPAIIVSTLGQALIHIFCMTYAVQWATDAMGPELLKEVTEFFRKAKAKEIDASSLCGEDDIMCQMNAFWTAPFMPNLLNSVVFLVETSQMISVFFANYKGRPWMKGMLENHALFLSVFACIGGVVVASWEMVPKLNEVLQLAPFPDDAFRYRVVALVTATILGTFLWDRLCTFLFAPGVFRAMRDEAKKTTVKDVLPVFMTLGKVAAVVIVLGTGNILLAGLAYYWYRNVSAKSKNQQPMVIP